MSFEEWLALVEGQARSLLKLLNGAPPSKGSNHEEDINHAIHLAKELCTLLAKKSQSQREALGIPPHWECKQNFLEESFEERMRKMIGAQTLPLVFSIVLFAQLYKWLHNQSILEAFGLSLQVDISLFQGFILLLGSLLTFALTVIGHEGLHAAAVLLTGKRPRFGWVRGIGFFTTLGHAALPQQTFLLIMLTPFMVITMIGLLLMLIPSIAHFAFIALVVNSAASVADLRLAWRALQAGPKAVVSVWGIYSPPQA